MARNPAQADMFAYISELSVKLKRSSLQLDVHCTGTCQISFSAVAPYASIHQHYLSSPFFNISVAVQKVIEDGIVRAIIHCLTL